MSIVLTDEARRQRESRLPLWAIAELRHLRQEVAYWRDQARTLPLPDAPLVVSTGTESLAGFQRYARAVFSLPGGQIEAYLDLGQPTVWVRSVPHGVLAVWPTASNTIGVQAEGWLRREGKP